jgi:hypothetical protein
VDWNRNGKPEWTGHNEWITFLANGSTLVTAIILKCTRKPWQRSCDDRSRLLRREPLIHEGGDAVVFEK